MKAILAFVKNIYYRNKQGPVNFRMRDPIIGRLVNETKRNVPSNTRFYSYVMSLARFCSSRNVSFKQNDNFFQILYNDAIIMAQPKPEPIPQPKPEPVPQPKPEPVPQPKPEIELIIEPESKSEKKAALLIGINYKGTSAELRGCENDIKNSKKMLISKYGFEEKDIIVLMESAAMTYQPTRSNILNYVNWLVSKSKSGYSTLWFQYSGHGTYIKDSTGDEKDGKDECIYTCDDKLIVDDEFHQKLVSAVEKDSKLFCFMDCCHSGTIMDLKYKYQSGQNASITDNTKKAALANVLAISGCKDTQTSADAWLSGSWCGALTKSFLDVLNNNSNNEITLFNLVKKIRTKLRKGQFTQIPQLTSSFELSSESKFVM